MKIGLEPFSLVEIVWFDSDLEMKQDEGSEVSYVRVSVMCELASEVLFRFKH